MKKQPPKIDTKPAKRTEDLDIVVQKKGNLLKQGSDVFGRIWRKKYIVLQSDGSILYWGKPEEEGQIDPKLIPLHNSTFKVGKTKQKDFVISVHNPQRKKNWLFATEDAEQQKEWVQAFRDVQDGVFHAAPLSPKPKTPRKDDSAAVVPKDTPKSGKKKKKHKKKKERKAKKADVSSPKPEPVKPVEVAKTDPPKVDVPKPADTPAKVEETKPALFQEKPSSDDDASSSEEKIVEKPGTSTAAKVVETKDEGDKKAGGSHESSSDYSSDDKKEGDESTSEESDED